MIFVKPSFLWYLRLTKNLFIFVFMTLEPQANMMKPKAGSILLRNIQSTEVKAVLPTKMRELQTQLESIKAEIYWPQKVLEANWMDNGIPSVLSIQQVEKTPLNLEMNFKSPSESQSKLPCLTETTRLSMYGYT